MRCPCAASTEPFSDAGVVARRLHAVMATKLGIARCLIVLVREIAIDRREPVGAMLARHAAQLPERLLEAFGQCGEALAAADRLDILLAAKCEPEMIEQMRDRRAGDRHHKATAIGEIRQRLPTRRVLLAKNELAFRTLVARQCATRRCNERNNRSG